MYNLKLIEMLTQRIAVYKHFSKGSSEKLKESAKSKWIISEVADRGTGKQHPAQKRWARARKWWKQHWILFRVFLICEFKMTLYKTRSERCCWNQPRKSTGAARVSTYMFSVAGQSNFAPTFFSEVKRSFDLNRVFWVCWAIFPLPCSRLKLP